MKEAQRCLIFGRGYEMKTHQILLYNKERGGEGGIERYVIAFYGV